LLARRCENAAFSQAIPIAFNCLQPFQQGTQTMHLFSWFNGELTQARRARRRHLPASDIENGALHNRMHGVACGSAGKPGISLSFKMNSLGLLFAPVRQCHPLALKFVQLCRYFGGVICPEQPIDERSEMPRAKFAA